MTEIRPTSEVLKLSDVEISDPGVDDAVALLVSMAALKSPAWVDTFGNASAIQTARNMRFLSEFEKRFRKEDYHPFEDMLFIGADRAGNDSQPFDINIEFIHGGGAMEGLALTTPTITESSSHLYHYLNQSRDKVDVFSFGAVTEVLAMIDQVGLSNGPIQSVTFMGGALVQQGNTDMHQEANFRHDPTALRELVTRFDKTGVPITIVPLDITEMEALEFSPERAFTLDQYLRANGSVNVANLITRLVGPDATYNKFYSHGKGRFDLLNYPPKSSDYRGPVIHDLTALMAKVHPELFDFETYPLKVGDDGVVGISRDYMRIDGQARVAVALKSGMGESYWQLVKNYLAGHYT